MALRTGTYDGPAKAIDYAGIAGGLLAPIAILVFTLWGAASVSNDAEEAVDAVEALATSQDDISSVTAFCVLQQSDRYRDWIEARPALNVSVRCDDSISRTDIDAVRGLEQDDIDALIQLVETDARPGYSHRHNMISDLGDRRGIVGQMFVAVNVAVGIFLVLFAYAVFRRMPVDRWVVLLLVVAAVLSAVLGLSRCQEGCSPDAGDDEWVAQTAHAIAGIGLVILIIAIPAAVAIDAPKRPRPSDAAMGKARRSLIHLTTWTPQVAVFPAVLTLLTTGEQGLFDGRYRGLFQRLTWGVGYLFIAGTAVVMWRLRRGRLPAPFDVRRLQENVVYGSSSRVYSRFMLCKIGDAETFRANLSDALESGFIRHEVPRPRNGTTAPRDYSVTVGFTYEGLRHLGIPYEWQAAGEDPFASGMKSRAPLLGDEKWSAKWENDDDLHVLFWLSAKTHVGLRQARAEHTAIFRDVTEINSVQTDITSKPLLGFRDGLSNPWIESIHSPKDVARQGGGKRNAQGDWEPLAIGEFVLGELDESREIFPVPAPQSIFHGGSFLVLRQIEVNEQPFIDAAKSLHDRLDSEVAEATCQAALMGRHADGTPLAASLDGPDGWKNNTFIYGDDPEGFGCPLGAHVRRANPRDSLGFDGVPSHRRRIIRRGAPYGDGSGLMFAAFNTRITDQFEFIQRQWLNDGDAFRLGAVADPVAGQIPSDSTTFVWHRGDGPVTAQVKQVSKTLGGAYLIVPGIDGLKVLSR